MILEDGATTGGPVQEQPCPQCNKPLTECACQAATQPTEAAESSSFDFSTIVEAGDAVVEVAAEIVGGIFGAIFD